MFNIPRTSLGKILQKKETKAFFLFLDYGRAVPPRAEGGFPLGKFL